MKMDAKNYNHRAAVGTAIMFSSKEIVLSPEYKTIPV